MGNVAIFKGKLVKFLAKAGILIPKRATTDRSLTPEQGETAFNTTDNKLEVYNGSSWVQLDAGGGGGTTGTLIHPTTNSTFEFGAQDNIAAGQTYTGWGNTAIGVDAGDSLSSGEFNTLYGYDAGGQLSKGFRNTFVGYGSGKSGTGDIVFGSTFNQNTAMGMYALQTLTTGVDNVAIGYSAGSGSFTSGSYNTIINSSANLTSGLSGIVLIGKNSSGGNSNATQSNDFVLGTSAHNYKLPGTIISFPLKLGSQNEIRFYDASTSFYIAFKSQTTVPANEVYELPTVTGTVGQVLGISSIPATGTTRLAWTSASGGTGTLVHPTTNSTFEYQTWNTTTPMTGTNNTGIGVGALDSVTTGSSNTAYGYNAGTNITQSRFNTLIGDSAGRTIAIGTNLAEGTSPGGYNTFVGANSGYNTSGSHNVAIGETSGWGIQGGKANVMIGWKSGYGISGTSNYNTMINTPGDLNPGILADISGTVAIGRDSIGTPALVTQDNDFVLGTSTHNYKLPGKINNGITIAEQSITPVEPTLGSECKIYFKNDKLVIQFNDLGTVRYKYLDLTGTDVTWVHTTVAP